MTEAPEASDADVPVRDAATVILLRDGQRGIEAWLMTRATQMVFAAGMAVFPGGRVDDADADLPFVTDSEFSAAQAMGCEPAQARALLGAAIRETFEETGVLLTAPSADLSVERAAVEAGERRFGDVLREHGLRADPRSLYPWARWVTPAGEVRRYDTRFFVCALPDGAQPQDLTTESSSAGWFAPQDAIMLAERGELGLLPPTLVNLASVAQFATVTEAVATAAARALEPVQARLTRLDGQLAVELPDGTLMSIPEDLVR